MARERIQGAVDVQDQIQAPKKRLVCADRRQTASRKSIEDQSRNTHLIELGRPGIDAGPDTARPVNDHDNRQTTRRLGDSKLTDDGCCLAPRVVTSEELPIAKSRRLNWM